MSNPMHSDLGGKCRAHFVRGESLDPLLWDVEFVDSAGKVLLIVHNVVVEYPSAFFTAPHLRDACDDEQLRGDCGVRSPQQENQGG